MGSRGFRRLTLLLLWILVLQCVVSGSREDVFTSEKPYDSHNHSQQFSTGNFANSSGIQVPKTEANISQNNTVFPRNETGKLSTDNSSMTLISTSSNSPVIKFSRLVSGLNPDQDIVSPLTEINIKLKIETQSTLSNTTLVEHYPEGWIVKESNGGILDVENNTLLWNLGNLNATASKSYTILSPQNLSLTEYEFTAEVLYNGRRDYEEPWIVIVGDSYDTTPIESSIQISTVEIPVKIGSSNNITANNTDNIEVSIKENETEEENSSVNLPAISKEDVLLLFDGFESGSLAVNKWNTSGIGDLWVIEEGTKRSYQGSFNALCSGEGTKTLETEIDTEGYENLNISFFYMAYGLNGSEYFAVDWYDGLIWNNIYNNTESTSGYIKTNLTLPENSFNNSFFRLRFKCNMGSGDIVCIDNIELTGKEIGNESDNGPYNESYNEPYSGPYNESYGQKSSQFPTISNSITLINETDKQSITPLSRGFIVRGTSNNNPVINSISDNPDPVDRGENIYITANVTDDISVSSVKVQIEETNYSMNGNIALENYTLVIQPGSEGKDAYIGEILLPDFGTASFLHIGHAWRGLLRFDISEIPVNAYITSADLGLYYYEDVISGPEDLGAFRLTHSWNALAVSWLFRDVLVFWSSPGGDFNPVAEDNLTIDSVFGWYNWNLTQMVKGWHNGTWTNHGVILKDYVYDERNGKYFYSSDSTHESLRPKLTVNYTISSLSDIWQLTFDTSPLPPGVYNYTIYANDGSGNNAIPLAGNFTVINSPPILSPIGAKEVNESQELSINLSAVDPNGDEITYSTNATFGTLTGNIFTWTPGLTNAGVYYVEFTVSDGELNDSEVITITVNEAYLNFSVSKKIEKGLSPDTYTVILNLESNVDFNSPGLRIYDFIPANFTLANPMPNFNGSQGSIYYWNLNLAAGEIKTVVYELEGTGRYSLREAFTVGVDPQ